MQRQGIAVFTFLRRGDFVRCHALVRLLSARFPGEPIDVVARAPGIGLAALRLVVPAPVLAAWSAAPAQTGSGPILALAPGASLPLRR